MSGVSIALIWIKSSVGSKVRQALMGAAATGCHRIPAINFVEATPVRGLDVAQAGLRTNWQDHLSPAGRWLVLARCAHAVRRGEHALVAVPRARFPSQDPGRNSCFTKAMNVNRSSRIFALIAACHSNGIGRHATIIALRSGSLP
jgi:hypothetical protein